MIRYHCQTMTAAGRRDWRLVEARDQAECVSMLVGEGLTPLRVSSRPPGFWEKLDRPFEFGARPGAGEQALIFTQLATLVRSGLPVDRSLDLLRDQAERAPRRRLFGHLLKRVRAGESLGEAMENEEAFPTWCTGVLRASELGGRLGDALQSVAVRLAVATETRQRLITALTYPAAVLLATMAALVIVLTSVVPQFEPVFAGSEEQLPALTQHVLALSAFARGEGVIMLTGVAILLGLVVIAFQTEDGRKALSAVRGSMPLIGLRDQYLAAQFAGLMATLTQNGVTVVSALPLARRTVASHRWRTELALVERKIREGTRLSFALRETSVFPLTASRLVEVGEQTGKLAKTFEKASEIMGSSAAARIDRLVALANPIAIISLGLVVALMVAGVMLGIFALGILREATKGRSAGR